MSVKLIRTPYALMLALLVLLSTGADPLGESPASTPEDPVLRAMKIELERSKAQLKLEQMAAPYYIDYQVVDMDRRTAGAAYGALRSDLHMISPPWMTTNSPCVINSGWPPTELTSPPRRLWLPSKRNSSS
jgi:hypothetical protein